MKDLCRNHGRVPWCNEKQPPRSFAQYEVVVISSHLENMFVKLDDCHLQGSGENKKYMNPPPRNVFLAKT